MFILGPDPFPRNLVSPHIHNISCQMIDGLGFIHIYLPWIGADMLLIHTQCVNNQVPPISKGNLKLVVDSPLGV